MELGDGARRGEELGDGARAASGLGEEGAFGVGDRGGGAGVGGEARRHRERGEMVARGSLAAAVRRQDDGNGEGGEENL